MTIFAIACVGARQDEEGVFLDADWTFAEAESRVGVGSTHLLLTLLFAGMFDRSVVLDLFCSVR